MGCHHSHHLRWRLWADKRGHFLVQWLDAEFEQLLAGWIKQWRQWKYIRYGWLFTKIEDKSQELFFVSCGCADLVMCLITKDIVLCSGAVFDTLQGYRQSHQQSFTRQESTREGSNQLGPHIEQVCEQVVVDYRAVLLCLVENASSFCRSRVP
jgi:hypothetical protein